MKKLIGIDLDQTTLNNDGVVTPRTQEVLRAVQDQGHVVAIITGRSPRLSRDIHEQIGLTSPLVTFNGGLAYHPREDWDDAYDFNFTSDILMDLMLRFEEFRIDGIVAENRTDAWGRSSKIELAPSESLFFPTSVKNRRLLTIDNLPRKVNETLLYVAPEHQPAVVDYVNKRYGRQDVEAIGWGHGSPIVSVRVNFVNKLIGLTSLQKSYGIEPDQVYAFGDEMNDYEMLSGAAHGIMMKNGNEKLAAVSDAVTQKTNDEDGLADYLENVLKLV
ncbi:HAD family phosphatase [Weissella minor]|uniref:HAD family hydrolase n=1 Tax=Weissella minor TaxID=1620 RepID=UPI001BAEE49C|nr:HAD family hydrolase [Weissella minor]MBS0949808.1 HAD family phosphatase [Weissella minor]